MSTKFNKTSSDWKALPEGFTLSTNWEEGNGYFTFSISYGGRTDTFTGDSDWITNQPSETDFTNYVASDYIAYNPGTEDGTFKTYVGEYFDGSIKHAYADGSHMVYTGNPFQTE